MPFVLALDIKLAAEKNLAVKSQLFIIQQCSKLLFGPSVRKKLCNLGLVKKKKKNYVVTIIIHFPFRVSNLCLGHRLLIMRFKFYLCNNHILLHQKQPGFDKYPVLWCTYLCSLQRICASSLFFQDGDVIWTLKGRRVFTGLRGCPHRDVPNFPRKGCLFQSLPWVYVFYELDILETIFINFS